MAHYTVTARFPLPPAAAAILDRIRAEWREGPDRRQHEEPVVVERRSRLDRRGGALGVGPTVRTLT